VFFPHANIEQYLPAFRLGPHIKSLTHRQARIQEILSQATVVVTDYSSVAFDAAFMLRAVIYFQFDKEEFFAGEHVCSKGFFDYARDGFGPCCHTEAELLNELEAMLKHGGVPEPKYLARMEQFFPHHDNRNCERVFDAVHGLLYEQTDPG
jgi:CDP-glycerol glycerophosphotransferase (TagB/SpsB family)